MSAITEASAHAERGTVANPDANPDAGGYDVSAIAVTYSAAELAELERIRSHRAYCLDLRDPRVIGPEGNSIGIPNRQVT